MSQPETKELIEIRNGYDRPIQVAACRSSLTGRLYIHVGECCSHGGEIVAPNNYEILEVNKVEA